jgi:hypothetical protein
MNRATVKWLKALACNDCESEVRTFMGQGMFGPVRTVTVEHERPCRWYAGHGTDEPKSSEAGILIHYLADEPVDGA